MTLPLTTPDLVCDLDLDPYGAETVSDLQSLIQDVTHVLLQTLGSNPDDPLRGVGIESLLSGTAPDFAATVGVIEAQLGSDDRITGVRARISNATGNPAAYVIDIDISVSGSVLGLRYGYDAIGGLTNTTPGV